MGSLYCKKYQWIYIYMFLGTALSHVEKMEIKWNAHRWATSTAISWNSSSFESTSNINMAHISLKSYKASRQPRQHEYLGNIRTHQKIIWRVDWQQKSHLFHWVPPTFDLPTSQRPFPLPSKRTLWCCLERTEHLRNIRNRPLPRKGYDPSNDKHLVFQDLSDPSLFISFRGSFLKKSRVPKWYCCV